MTALITKHTKEVRVVEPLALLICAYLAYMMAELVHFSGQPTAQLCTVVCLLVFSSSLHTI